VEIEVLILLYLKPFLSMCFLRMTYVYEEKVNEGFAQRFWNFEGNICKYQHWYQAGQILLQFGMVVIDKSPEIVAQEHFVFLILFPTFCPVYLTD
jgi:hypothetical protein